MEEEKILAKVESMEISTADVDRLIQLMGHEGEHFKSSEGRERLKEELISQKLLLLDAKKKNLQEEEAFKEELKRVMDQLLQQYALRKLLSEVVVDEEIVKEYYKAHKARFKDTYTYHANHILVNHLEEIQAIQSKLEQGEAFEDLAKQYSQCPSRKDGGNLGNFSSGQMVKEFDEALEAMEVGEISAPVQTQFGYHIIRLNAKKKTRGSDFASVKDQIFQELTLLKQQEHYVNYIRDLEKVYEVERYHAE